MKYIFLGLFAVLAYTSAMMYEPQQTGYSQADQAGMDRLVGRVLLERPTRKKHHGLMSGTEQAAAMLYLWGDGQ